ncbi:hypothetical protein [Thalassococcus lentus]|uniref:TFIIB zinc-binding n=1 Tax=Thalassococcus lentus TaxID=1210524 RepID=A0ABT4XTW8_9RHOB|nr:hypothetical protein [Thalassococcus lentus]MDA7425414.1 hypothetical protein [Thalassococcus lentus]
MPQTKIATCCYCGTRAALVLRGKDRHELSCSSCGAQLHDMKMLRADAVDGHAHPTPMSRRRTRAEVHATPLPAWEREALSNARRSKPKKKKRKSLAKRFFEEAFDVIEDILD